jgi:hypothetical protein
MSTPDYAEALSIDANYDWGAQNKLGLEDRVVISAAACLLLSFEVDTESIEHPIPGVQQDDLGDEDTIEISYDRCVADPIPTSSEKSVVFDQFHMLDDEFGDGIWCAEPGVFSMLIISDDGDHLAQYLFRTSSTIPLRGEVYCGYSFSPENRVTTPQHLGALLGFLDKLQVIIIQDVSAVLSEHPTISSDDDYDPEEYTQD